MAHSFSVNLFWHRPPKVSSVIPLALLIWVSRSVLLWPFLLLAFFRYDRTILTFAFWRNLLCSYALLFYPIPDWFLLAILHFHKVGHLFFPNFSFQRPLINLLNIFPFNIHVSRAYVTTGLITEKYNYIFTFIWYKLSLKYFFICKKGIYCLMQFFLLFPLQLCYLCLQLTQDI